MKSVADLRSRGGLDYERRSVTHLPDPEPRPIWCPIISADDHALEPPSLFSRMPSKLRDDAPRLEEDEKGLPFWVIGDVRSPITISDGAVGRPISEWNFAPQKYEDFRLGVHDAGARVKDMDLNGVWASLNFPSQVWGFAGTLLSKIPNPEVSLAAIRAYNDWALEEWCATAPTRFITCQLPWFVDPEVAAKEIRANAKRGFRSVTFSENPEMLGYPSLYSGHWDPFFQACSETQTVINLHVGSSGAVTRPSSDSPSEVIVTLFPLNGICALIDWIYAKIPIRFPDIKVVLSEGGVSWVPMARERLARAYRQREQSKWWKPSDPDPRELVARNFWFTSIEDPSAFAQIDLIGRDRIMVESDYPHKDSSWPDTQALLAKQMQGLDTDTIQQVCFRTASDLYRHPVPPADMMEHSVIGAKLEEREPPAP